MLFQDLISGPHFVLSAVTGTIWPSERTEQMLGCGDTQRCWVLGRTAITAQRARSATTVAEVGFFDPAESEQTSTSLPGKTYRSAEKNKRRGFMVERTTSCFRWIVAAAIGFFVFSPLAHSQDELENPDDNHWSEAILPSDRESVRLLFCAAAIVITALLMKCQNGKDTFCRPVRRAD